MSPPEPLESQLELSPRSQPFQPGQQVVVVEVCCDKPWTVRPVTVVADDEQAGVVLWLAGGTMTRYPAGPQHGRHTVPRWLTGEWELIDREWVGTGVLMLCRLGQRFEVRVTPELDSEPWYVNLTEPWRRVASGFVTMDQTLDLLVARDMSGWSWKDEDEFAYAQQIGVYTAEQANEIHRIGNDVIARVEAGDPPWDATWAKWTPENLPRAR